MSDPFGTSTFDKAMRKRARRKLATRLKDEDTQELLPLPEVTRRLRQFEQHHVGIQPIPIRRIVGTVDRSRDFDREFLPRSPQIEDRWKRVERAFPDGTFPPIVVYEVDGSYFLEDGHHRVAIAKQRGAEFIDAEITQLRTRSPLPPEADIGLLIHIEQERLFRDESGLREARPEASITLTRPHGYLELLELVRVHGYHLMKERGEVISDAEIAGDWYDRVYLPVMEAAREASLAELFTGTDGDLFLWLHHHRLALYPERGGISNEEVARLAREEVQGRRRRIRRRTSDRP
jgi:hypothetical protein